MSRGPRVVLVTGASGFVGSHLVEHLLALGDRARVLVRASSVRRHLAPLGVEEAVADLSDGSPQGEAALARAAEGCAVVFHVAGVVRARDPREYEEVNAAGAERIARAAAAAGAPRFLLVSSQAAAGPGGPDRPRREEDPESPVTAYGRSKLAGERRVLDVARGSGLAAVIVRPPAVYGPRDRAFLTLFRLVARGVLPLYPGSRTQEVSLVHARDLARGIALAAERGPAGRAYYLTDGARHTSAQIGEAIARALGKRPLRLEVPMPLATAAALGSELYGRLTGRATTLTRERLRQWTARRWSVSDERARREIGYVPEVDLESGMRETAAWYREAGWISA